MGEDAAAGGGGQHSSPTPSPSPAHRQPNRPSRLPISLSLIEQGEEDSASQASELITPMAQSSSRLGAAQFEVRQAVGIFNGKKRDGRKRDGWQMGGKMFWRKFHFQKIFASVGNWPKRSTNGWPQFWNVVASSFLSFFSFSSRSALIILVKKCLLFQLNLFGLFSRLFALE
jgi:hypothetical protein